ncbi:MAG: Imm74 family immunity protein [Spirochaetales bacterium]|nr:Imm74 family immunity protein [Spirochaetales bacterium]
MIKITGTNTFIDVEIDGRIVRIQGEMGMGEFYCHKGSMQEWLVPAGEKISEEDKKMIIQRVMEKTAGSHMVITFDEEEPVKTETKKKELSIVPKDTAEKYLGYMNTIVNEILDLLKKLNLMIEAQFDKEAENEKNNIFFDENCFDEFLEQYKKVITPFCTEVFLSKWYRNSIAKPGNYYYLNESATVYFTMKRESKALVFIEPTEEISAECYKFELINVNGKYLIDKMFYYFKREQIYHKMQWL